MRRALLVLVLALVVTCGSAFASWSAVGPFFGVTPSQAQAQISDIPGTWASSVTVQNQSATDVASVTLDFYDEAGTIVQSVAGTIDPGKSKLWYVPNIAGLPSGKYSVVVSSSTPVVAIANLSSTSPSTGGSYSGANDTAAANSFFIPSVYKSYYNYQSTIVVQNADSVDASVTVNFKGGSVNYTAPAVVVKPGASHTWDAATISQLPSGWTGAATVTSTGGKVVAILNVYTSGDPKPRFSTTNWLASGSTTAYVPVLYKGYYGFDTSFIVQNVSADANTVSVTYSNGLTEADAVLQPGASKLYYQPGNASLPNGFKGSAKVTSKNGKNLIAVANVVNFSNGSLSAYNGFASGSTKVTLPSIYKYYYGWVSSLTVQNVDPTNAVTVNVTYTNGATEAPFVLQPGASKLFFNPNTAGLPNGFSGGATVTSTGGNVVAVVNIEKKLNDANNAAPGAGDWLMSYNGFN